MHVFAELEYGCKGCRLAGLFDLQTCQRIAFADAANAADAGHASCMRTCPPCNLASCLLPALKSYLYCTHTRSCIHTAGTPGQPAA
eukprot:366555-Chlamydomonas_euryale.AAC.23